MAVDIVCSVFLYSGLYIYWGSTDERKVIPIELKRLVLVIMILINLKTNFIS